MLAWWRARATWSVAMPIVFRSIEQLKKNLSRALDDSRKADVVITLRGTPTLFLCRLAEHELEGALLMQSSSTRRRMRRALTQIRSGRGFALGGLVKEVVRQQSTQHEARLRQRSSR
jgi:hypothetical protein